MKEKNISIFTYAYVSPNIRIHTIHIQIKTCTQRHTDMHANAFYSTPLIPLQNTACHDVLKISQKRACSGLIAADFFQIVINTNEMNGHQYTTVILFGVLK